MGTELLEREEALTQLHTALARARGGRGEVVTVAAEAGAGKTVLIGEFQRLAAGRPAFLLGACDPLSTPRLLGPLIDVVGTVDGELALRLAAGTNRGEAFAVALSLVDGTRSDATTVFVIEDAHWADEATLDLITFLGRRMARTASLLVITYRDDEIDVGHPLRPRLGELAGAITTRVQLPPLSRAAVAELAQRYPTDVDADELHRTTGGNAFFVTEVLGAGTTTLPASVRDAVLARADRLPPDARAVLDAAAIVPGRVERWLIDEMVGTIDTSAGLAACVERALVNIDQAGTIGFRHELARAGVASALTTPRRRELHRRAYAALRDPPMGQPDETRLAHHAAEAEDADAVLTHAPVAAAAAERIGAHREAERHLAAAVRFADRLDPSERADLLVRLATERVRIGRNEESLSDYGAALELRRRIGDIDGVAEALSRTARPLGLLGRQPEAVEAVERAVALVDERPPSSAKALVLTHLAASHMLARRLDECEVEARRAIAMAEKVGDDDALAEVCIQSGIALAMTDDHAGLTRIRRGMEVAGRCGNDQMVLLGYSQIGSGYGEIRRYEVAMPALRDGIEFAEQRELIGALDYERAWLARCELETGKWDDAAATAGSVLRSPRSAGIGRFVALLTLAWVRGRRGDPEVDPLLDEALEIARATRHLQRLWPVAACRAEMAWMDGRLADELDLVEEAAELAHSLDWAPAIEELAHWRHVADGVARGDVDTARTPFGLSAAGRPDLAAARWAEVGCPYEEAAARIATGNDDEVSAALTILDRLGAGPLRSRAAAILRDAGVNVPRSPSLRSRQNPHDLTDREMEVLALLTTGGTNRELGAALGISPKTVGHHVSHILAKLDVANRAEAAVAAERLGVAPTSDR